MSSSNRCVGEAHFLTNLRGANFLKTGRWSQSCILLQIPSTTVNNGAVHTEPKVGNRDRERNRIGSGESERESLLLHETAAVTPKYLRTQRSVHSGGGVVGGGGGGGSGVCGGGSGLGGGGGLGGIGAEPGGECY